MNIKTNLLEDYVNFADLIKKQNTYFKIFITFFVVFSTLFFFLLNTLMNNTFPSEKIQKSQH